MSKFRPLLAVLLSVIPLTELRAADPRLVRCSHISDHGKYNSSWKVELNSDGKYTLSYSSYKLSSPLTLSTQLNCKFDPKTPLLFNCRDRQPKYDETFSTRMTVSTEYTYPPEAWARQTETIRLEENAYSPTQEFRTVSKEEAELYQSNFLASFCDIET